MPTYTYACKKCEHEMTVFHAISAKPKVACEACGSKAVERLIGTGAGLIFKGSGFYETDYKRNGNGSSKSNASEGASKGESKGGESKSSESGSKAGSGESGTSSSKKSSASKES
jgi:putative FmdB family regulatory protein